MRFHATVKLFDVYPTVRKTYANYPYMGRSEEDRVKREHQGYLLILSDTDFKRDIFDLTKTELFLITTITDDDAYKQSDAAVACLMDNADIAYYPTPHIVLFYNTADEHVAAKMMMSRNLI